MKKCYNVFDEVKLVSTVFKLTRFATFGFLVYLNMYVSSAAWVVAVSSAANSVEFMSSLCLFRQGEHIANKKKKDSPLGRRWKSKADYEKDNFKKVRIRILT